MVVGSINAPGRLSSASSRTNVTAASVQIRGAARRPAIVQANGILYELPDGSCTNWAFESLTAPYVEGTSEKILTTWITWHHGSSDLPDSCAG